MKKPYLLLVLVLCTSCNVHNEHPRSINLESSLLWEISGNGLASPSYLFGTNHLFGQKFLNSLPLIGKKFKTCRAVAGEVVFDTAKIEKLRPMLRFENDSLTHILSVRDFSAVASAFKKYGNLDLNRYNYYKPKVIKVMLVMEIARPLASASNPSLDEYFQIKGRENSYKIIGFETIEFDNDLAFNQAIDVQKRHLLITVDSIDLTRRNIKKSFDLYRKQDLNELQKQMLTDKEYTQKEQDQLVKNRNQKWLAKLPDIMKQQPTFIAVGVTHLFWDIGLINQLRLKGYTVKPVKM
jgi:uncharacterized protein